MVKYIDFIFEKESIKMANFVRKLFRIDEKLLKKVEQRANLVLA